jgi:nodulation protein E
MQDRRVAITGIGIVSALGRGRGATLGAVAEGRGGVRLLRNCDVSNLTCRIGAEVDAAHTSGLDPSFDRFAALALLAAADATEEAALADAPVGRDRIGVIIGTGMGGTTTLDEAYERLYGRRQPRVAPMTIPRSMYNAAASAIAAAHHAEGPVFATVSSCSSSAHAIAQAFFWIRSGLADVVIAGGADAPLVHGSIRGWEALRVLAPEGDDPSRACRPFSADRAGFALGEGAAVFVLEELGDALRRGAAIEGEIAGAGITSDAGHLTDPSADGATRAIEMALATAGLSPSEVGYVNAHGTGTRANDPMETEAIRAALGSHATAVPVSSTKAMHGHTMGASGAIELALSLAALNESLIPPTINFTTPDPACDLDVVPNTARRGNVATFLSNSFGFGGLNGVLAVHTRHRF